MAKEQQTLILMYNQSQSNVDNWFAKGGSIIALTFLEDFKFDFIPNFLPWKTYVRREEKKVATKFSKHCIFNHEHVSTTVLGCYHHLYGMLELEDVQCKNHQDELSSTSLALLSCLFQNWIATKMSYGVLKRNNSSLRTDLKCIFFGNWSKTCTWHILIAVYAT